MFDIKNDNNYLEKLEHPIFSIVSDVAENSGIDAYVIGGYVRDLLLSIDSDDIDIMVIGNGIDFAKSVASYLNEKEVSDVAKQKYKQKYYVEEYGNFGTAMLHFDGEKIEFAGARKESYSFDSRKPAVEKGTLEDDQKRRDFTINAMAISLNKYNFGELIDPFDGVEDLYDGIIRTPLDPDITFSDDPLRMFRAIRFSSRLYFDIEEETFESIKRNAHRISILSAERIAEELNKMMLSRKPSYAFKLLDESGLLKMILPEINALKGVDRIGSHGHKEVFLHTLEVLDNVANKTNSISQKNQVKLKTVEDIKGIEASINKDIARDKILWLRWAALLHDVAKPQTKRFDAKTGWSFHNHEFIGSKMVPKIFERLKLPSNEKMKYVQKLVSLHLRPIALVDDVVTDSAVRRLLFEAGDDIEDLMILCNADVTSKNPEKVKKYQENFLLVEQKMVEIEEKDRIRNFKLPVDGTEIMQMFNIPPSKQVGIIRESIKEAILEGVIPNDHTAAVNYIREKFLK
ncbi:tRNA nucleotidyltransferase [Bacteroidia bacterium]|nr:tRNA nucleotidyltransferase [Bacteroidia bacterium]